MDENELTRLEQVASGALVNHWPPHLGLTTDSQRIEHLADGVSKLVDYSRDLEGRNETLSDEVENANDRIRELEQELEQAKKDAK